MAVMLHILDDGEALGNIATAAVGNKVQVLVRKLGLPKIRIHWSAHPARPNRRGQYHHLIPAQVGQRLLERMRKPYDSVPAGCIVLCKALGRVLLG